MSPTEVEEYIMLDPFQPLRITLASGDQIVVNESDRPFVTGLALILRGDPVGQKVTDVSRLISIPNICLVEPAIGRPGAGRRRGR